MGENIDDLFLALLEELDSSETLGERLDQIASEHLAHDFDCDLCECFRESDGVIWMKIAGHENCLEITLDKLLGWGEGRGDPGYEVDVLLSACSRSSFSGKWLEYVLDTAWIYRLQFEGSLHFEFIRNLMDSRELTDQEKQRIMKANDMTHNGQSFPTREDLARMGL